MIRLGRHRRAAAALLTLIATAFPLSVAVPAHADPTCSGGGGPAVGYQWCGDHWRWSDLPVSVYVNTSGLPSGVSASDLIAAVQGAVDAWERAALALPLGPPTGLCPTGGRALCYRGTTSAGKAADGLTVVMFGATASQATLADTRICYAGSGCPASSSLGRMKDADVTLRNTGVMWKQAGLEDVAKAEATGFRGPYCIVIACPGWHDLQSIVTHELGHVLGLEETEGLVPGCNGPGEWPGDPSDAVNHSQTMYPCHWKGHTNRRTLEAGDLLGLTAVMAGARLDP